jgi:hypothetical protein
MMMTYFILAAQEEASGGDIFWGCLIILGIIIVIIGVIASFKKPKYINAQRGNEQLGQRESTSATSTYEEIGSATKAIEKSASEKETSLLRGGLVYSPRFDYKKIPDSRITENALNTAIEELLPVSSQPASITTILLPYERDSKIGSTKRYVIDGEERVSIEDKALSFLAESGYVGFHAENRFWEHFSSFLFYRAMLISHGTSGGCLPWPIVNPDPERIDINLYIEEFDNLKATPDLKALVHNCVKHYLGLRISPLEEKRRSSQRFKNSLAWFDIIIDNVDRCTLLRIVDWTIRSPGGQVKGMPDLILLRDNRISFAEVKSEGDPLRKEQTLSLDFLSSKLGFEVFLVVGVTGA